MNVGMEPHALVPRVEHGGEAVDVRPQSFVGGELFGQRSGNGRKEQIVALFGQRGAASDRQGLKRSTFLFHFSYPVFRASLHKFLENERRLRPTMAWRQPTSIPFQIPFSTPRYIDSLRPEGENIRVSKS